MPRPSTKKDLLELADFNFKKLFDFIDQVDNKQRVEDFKTDSLNRNFKDVLYHLHIWHIMTLEWNRASLQNYKPEIPAKGYTWKTLPDLNRKIQKDGENFTFDQAKELVNSSHREMLQTITDYSADSLFKKKIFKWTGSTSVGAYFVSSTASHYDWALKFLKKAVKN